MLVGRRITCRMQNHMHQSPLSSGSLTLEHVILEHAILQLGGGGGGEVAIVVAIVIESCVQG